MNFNSLEFLVFFPIVFCVYYLIPHRFRSVWLLLCSYFFYMNWNAKYALLLAGVTCITYIFALLIEKRRQSNNSEKAAKLLLITGIVANFAVLFVFKYFNFFTKNINSGLSLLHVPYSFKAIDVILPVGISFYIFQAVGYLIDVYRKDTPAENNFITYALFVSFFPQLVAGPIERSKNLLKQLKEKKEFNYESIKENALLIIWGLMLKLMIADRIGVYVDNVFEYPDVYSGTYIFVAIILFAFQIYCDFAGYSTIAIGVAGTLGFSLIDNFNAPYCSSNIKEFWDSWHISLTSWFRDYLYIPLGGNRKGKIRKWINTMIVFAVSGLWHGAMWSFVVWGCINGFYLVIYDATKEIRRKIANRFGISKNIFAYRFTGAIFTFVLVDISWLFFRANGIASAKKLLSYMFATKNIQILFDGTMAYAGLDEKNMHLLIICLIVLLTEDSLKKKGVSVRKWILTQPIWFRWCVYVLSIAIMLIFGVWGSVYDKAAFIYFQF